MGNEPRQKKGPQQPQNIVPQQKEPQELTPDEKKWAAAAHGSAILLPPIIPLGMLIAMAIWLFKRKISRYVGHQALQAFIYQAVASLIIVVIGELAGTAGEVILFLIALVYALYAAYQCYNGYNFKYAVIGNLTDFSRPRQ